MQVEAWKHLISTGGEVKLRQFLPSQKVLDHLSEECGILVEFLPFKSLSFRKIGLGKSVEIDD